MDQPTSGADQPITRKQRREQQREQERTGRVKQERGKQMKTFVIWFIVIVAVVGGIVLLAKYGGSSSGGTSTKTVTAVSPDDWTKGKVDSPVTVIEYSDLQCPACGAYYPTVKRLIDTYGDRVLFVYRHFPLRSIHKNAQLAAQYAEAAGQQGKFWELHDQLFEAQTEWADEGNPEGKFKEYAEKIGLDTDRLATDANAQAARDRVNNDYNSGNVANVSATPTFFVNGKKIAIPRSYEDFAKILDDALAATP